MLEKVIESCFSDVRKAQNQSQGKRTFGLIWSVLASRRTRFKTGDMYLSWRELSSTLAIIYNKWYGTMFTTDAFYLADTPDRPIGELPEYDDVLMKIYGHDDCIGIYRVHSGSPVSSQDKTGIFMETDVVTGEVTHYKQKYKHGKPEGTPLAISADEYQSLAYSD